MKNEKKMNNNGFSLIELIIVIAIMAVLIGVLAPQYMKYVERGRVSADRDNVDSIVSALEVWAADPQAKSALANGAKIVISRSGATITEKFPTGAVATAQTPVKDALSNAGLPDTDDKIPKLTNQQTFTDVTIEVVISDSNFSITTTYKNGSVTVTF